jgi:hypothetical protein
MRTRGAAVQGGLAAIALIGAYTTWQRQPERPAGEVVVMDLGKNDLQKVRYDDGPKWIELTSAMENGERVVYLKLSKNEQTKAPERELRGNDGALKLWEKFTPLHATRALGALAADKLKELSLDAPKGKIQITARGETRTLDVGAPLGVSDPYIKDERDSKVYVLGGGVVSDLQSAAVRLVDRTMHGFKPNEFDGLVMQAGGKQRELVQTGTATAMQTRLASKKSPDKPDEMAKNWHDKLWRLYVTDLLGKGEEPAGGAPQVALRVEYSEHGKTKGFIEVGRIAAPPPKDATSSAPPPPAEFYGRTEHTAGWAKLPPTTDDLLKEAEKIAAAE